MSEKKSAQDNLYKLFLPDLPVPVKTAFMIFTGALLFVTLPVWGTALFLCLIFWLIYALGKNAVELGERALGGATREKDGGEHTHSGNTYQHGGMPYNKPGATTKRHRDQSFYGSDQGGRVPEESGDTRKKGGVHRDRPVAAEDNAE
jgi:hypothetical protein